MRRKSWSGSLALAATALPDLTQPCVAPFDKRGKREWGHDMAYVNEQQRILILDWILRRVSDEEFLRDYPVDKDAAPLLGMRVLEAATAARDPLEVELGLILGYRFEFSRAYLPVLLTLVNADWHFCHGDVVSALDVLAAPESVDALYEAALAHYPYRDSDDVSSLGLKAIWALGKIADLSAVMRLGQLLTCGERVLERHAARQLDRIERQATNAELRRAARLAGSVHTNDADLHR